MKKLILASSLALTSPSMAQEVPLETLMNEGSISTLQQLDEFLWTECREVWRNTAQQCVEIILPYWYIGWTVAKMKCQWMNTDNQKECFGREVLEYLKDNIEEILEKVREPVGEAL